jgi:hypothetical protein
MLKRKYIRIKRGCRSIVSVNIVRASSLARETCTPQGNLTKGEEMKKNTKNSLPKQARQKTLQLIRHGILRPLAALLVKPRRQIHRRIRVLSAIIAMPPLAPGTRLTRTIRPLVIFPPSPMAIALDIALLGRRLARRPSWRQIKLDGFLRQYRLWIRIIVVVERV